MQMARSCQLETTQLINQYSTEMDTPERQKKWKTKRDALQNYIFIDSHVNILSMNTYGFIKKHALVCSVTPKVTVGAR